MFHAKVRDEEKEKSVCGRRETEKNWIKIVVTVLKIFTAINNFMKVKKFLFDWKLSDYRFLFHVLKICKEKKKKNKLLNKRRKVKIFRDTKKEHETQLLTARF